MIGKKYLIDQSPFYKMVGKGKLSRTLGINLAKTEFVTTQRNYRIWTNETGREIQEPINNLMEIHKKINSLLSRIKIPDYVFSQKCRSYIDNAKQHIKSVPLGKIDIAEFYLSITRKKIWYMFLSIFKCANDVANILADLCSFEKSHLPTGSPLSERIAFFTAYPMFNEIYSKAISSGSRMTLYVDDITLSGQSVSKKLIYDIHKIILQHGFKAKKSKIKIFSSNAPKVVTGVIVCGNNIRVPNSRHKKITEIRREIPKSTGIKKHRLKLSLDGCVQEAQQIINSKTTPRTPWHPNW